MYFFWQQHGGEERWKVALATDREQVIREQNPAFVTVLNVSHAEPETLPLDEILALHYEAPYGFFMDFDSSEIEESIQAARLMVVKLRDAYEFDPAQARYFYSGSKGIHIEIPITAFLKDVPNKGVQNLPLIFKEMAQKLFVDCLDLRVYSSKRTRQWRCPNVRRDNGKYKVQVSWHELEIATPEDYQRVTSDPRPTWPVAASYNRGLAALFMSCKDAAAAAVKKKRARKVETKVDHFRGEWPDTARLILAGEGLKPEVGWNQIAMQVAAMGLAIGKSEEQILEDAAELIATHAGDSDRYGTERKRERELRNQIRYQDGNPGFEFSIGGVRSLLQRGIASGDLDDPGDYDQHGAETPPAEGAAPKSAESDEIPATMDVPVRFGKGGIGAKIEDTWKLVCPIGITDPIMMFSVTGNHDPIGYEITTHFNGKTKPGFISMNQLLTKASFNQWVNATHATWQDMTDKMTTMLNHRLNMEASRKKQLMYMVSREGIDFLIPPGSESRDDYEIIYSSPDKCLSTRGTQYRLLGHYVAEGTYKSDLLKAPALEATEHTKLYFERLLTINSDDNLARFIGWFSACFLCQPIRHLYKEFPLLGFAGQAGSGKSKTIEVMLGMHYYLQHPKKMSASGNTFFPILAAVTQSASVPMVLEEYKPRSMAPYQLNQIRNLLKINYEGDAIERGTLNKDQADKGAAVNSHQCAAPIAFVAEAVETESAIQERTISVLMSKETRRGASEDFEWVLEQATGGPLSSLGRTMVDNALALNMSDLRESMGGYKKQFRELVGQAAYENMSRPWHNGAVILVGLDFFAATLRRVFGDAFDARINEIKAAFLNSFAETTKRGVMPEAAKVLDVMAQLTRSTDAQYRMEKGNDYIVHQMDGRVVVDIRMKPAFAKYIRYRKGLGMELLYDNEGSFITGMELYHGYVTDKCGDSPLFRTPWEKIHRFDCSKLNDDCVEEFEM